MEVITTGDLPETAWNLGSASTEVLIDRLRELGINPDRESVRREALRAGSPSALAETWIERLEPRPRFNAPRAPLDAAVESLITEMAFELWHRWLADVTCAEILADEFDREYEPLDTLMFGNPFVVTEAVHRAHRIINAVAPPGGQVDRELFEEIWSHTWHDLALWLRCLPQVLAHRGLLDEAIDLCGRLAPIFEARAFLADRAILLAQAGRSHEAAGQVASNVRAWPKDPVVLRKSCETLWALGRADEALLLYDDVLEALEGQRRMPAEDVITAS